MDIKVLDFVTIGNMRAVGITMAVATGFGPIMKIWETEPGRSAMEQLLT